jgi:hypothetical protein
MGRFLAIRSYPEAQGDASDVSGYLCFGPDELVTEVGQSPRWASHRGGLVTEVG